MGRPVVWESVTLVGVAEQARAARDFVGGILGPGHPCREEAVLLVTELFANSVRHSCSGAPGETVTVAVSTANGIVRVQVTDRSGPGVPHLRPARAHAECGRGLALVACLATQWGWRRLDCRTVTWFDLAQDAPGCRG